MTAWVPSALAYVTRWLDYQMRESRQPGCVIAVAHQGEVLLERAFGHADLATKEAMTPRHRFRVASHSKTFTAAAILKLREQGRLRLDDTAGQYVSGLHPDVAAATLAQLLSHSAGLVRDGAECAFWSENGPFPDIDRLRADLTQPPTITANTRMKYSNHGFGLAGLVVEAITSERYVDWVGREIVAAAGLTETSPEFVDTARPMARGHSLDLPLGRRVVFPGETDTGALAAATGFVSTAADLARFFGQLAPTAATSVLSPASRREMARPQWREQHGTWNVSYGLGTISGTVQGWDWFGHSGGFPGYLTRTAVVPEREISVSVLTNAADGLSGPWLDGVLGILRTFADGGAPTDLTQGWAGRWWNLWAAVDLVPVGDKVLVAMPALPQPLDKAAEITLTGADVGTITLAGSFRNHGEPVRRKPQSGLLWLGGNRLTSEAAMAEQLTTRYAAAD